MDFEQLRVLISQYENFQKTKAPKIHFMDEKMKFLRVLRSFDSCEFGQYLSVK